MKKHFLILLMSLICLTATACSTIESYNEESATDIVDMNLAGISSTVVYAAIVNILQNPENYLGKTIRISGDYHTFYFEPFDRYFHFVSIEGPTGCCPQALKFIYGSDRTSLDNYPTENALIEVVGVFSSYEEMGRHFYYLAVDNLIVK